MTTPNNRMTLSRNPWHEREYVAGELKSICEKYFDEVEMLGVAGSERVMNYHEENRASVNKIMKWDVLDLQHKLPAWVLRKPYEILNRRNRDKLKSGNDDLVMSIGQDDYFLREMNEQNLDLFCIASKK